MIALTPRAAARWTTLALALLAPACHTPFEEPRPPEEFVRQARAVLGNVDFTLFHVPSHGLLRDKQYVDAAQRGGAPDHLADELAGVLRRGAQEPVAVVAVGGGSSDKTTRVLEDAFASLSGIRLPALELLVLVDPHHVPAVRAAARGSGCRLMLADLDGE